MKSFFILLLAGFFISACSPARRLERILHRNPHLVSLDTLQIRDSVMVPGVKIDTIISLATVHDTIRIEKDRLELRFELKHDTISVTADCKGDTIYIDHLIPVEKVKLVRPDTLDNLISKIPWLVVAFISVLLLRVFFRR